jgi:hypothetical protein
MAETYPFTTDPSVRIYDYKKTATLLEYRIIDHNYDHRFTQVNTYGRAASNVVPDLTGDNYTPTACGFRGCDILLKPSAVIIYTGQSIITGYKLALAYIEHIYNVYLKEPFVIPVERIFIDNLGTYPSTTGIDGTKQFKFNHVKVICVLFPRHVSVLTVQFNP